MPEAEYDSQEIVRRVGTTKDYISFKGRLWKVPKAFCGERLAIRPPQAIANSEFSSPPIKSQPST
ncbi:MAG: hypothetical protein JO365_26695 [Bradyrhizobium sp.]|nr:hypothetical protein [Bradyrhizobium sp.]